MGIAMQCLGLVLLASAGDDSVGRGPGVPYRRRPGGSVVLRLHRTGPTALHSLQHRRHRRVKDSRAGRPTTRPRRRCDHEEPGRWAARNQRLPLRARLAVAPSRPAGSESHAAFGPALSNCPVLLTAHFAGLAPLLRQTSTSCMARKSCSRTLSGRGGLGAPRRTPRRWRPALGWILALRPARPWISSSGSEAMPTPATTRRDPADFLTPLEQELQCVTGAYPAHSPGLSTDVVSTTLAGQEFGVQTDLPAPFSLLLPEGKQVLRATKAQYKPWQGEVTVAQGGRPPPVAFP